MHAVQLSAGHWKVARHARADGDDDRIVLLAQLLRRHVDADVDAVAEGDAFGLARFTADSRLRSKIGISRAGATGWIGAWDEARGVLTLVNHTIPPRDVSVPDCDWKPDNPRAAEGDVATSYNNGGEPGFFELESLSAALPNEPGGHVEHVSTTIHLGGDREALRGIARAVLHADI